MVFRFAKHEYAFKHLSDEARILRFLRGCAGLGDPAIEFGVIIYYYGESFIDRFYEVYPEAKDYLKRARFYAGEHEVGWLVTGIERNEPRWFGIHVGGAQDIGYD